MSYNFPSPRRRKPNFWGFFFLALVVAAFIYARLPSDRRPALPRFVENWRRKILPSASQPQKAPIATRTPWAAPTAQVRPFPSSPGLALPEVTPPAVSRSQPAPERVAPGEITSSNLPLQLPGPPRVRAVRDARIAQLEAKIAKYPVFALHRDLAERHLALGNTEQAAGVFRTQAALFRRKGLEDAAQVLEKRAAQYETTVRVFAARAGGGAAFTHARLEPARGCYLGAFIDRDDALPTRFAGDNWQHHRLPSEFEARVGRRHATVFTYVKWGNFPREWLQMCKREGVIPHIAWEPQNLREVKNDAYLRGCAQFVRDLDWPVFVRFAGEMNGHWTPYHGNPPLYREKFGLVHRTLHQYAPKVATIWCVNAIPSDNIDAYYPGDANCDWVGVNLYSTPFADNDRTRAAFRESPLTLLDPIYRRYSDKKPLAICEYAASHQSAVDGVARPDFAVEKMSLLYGALPLLYPRVKMINWFSTNNLIHARAGRQLNNYRLTQHPALQEAYRNLTASTHFLTAFQGQGGPSALPQPREIGPGERVRAGERLYLWVTSTSSRPAVFVQAATQVVYGGRRVGKHVLETGLPPKADSLAILVFDEGGRCVKRRDLKIEPS